MFNTGRPGLKPHAVATSTLRLHAHSSRTAAEHQHNDSYWVLVRTQSVVVVH